jgi:hypothetical protein
MIAAIDFSRGTPIAFHNSAVLSSTSPASLYHYYNPTSARSPLSFWPRCLLAVSPRSELES